MDGHHIDYQIKNYKAMTNKQFYITPESEKVVIIPREAVLNITSDTTTPSPDPLTISAIIGGTSDDGGADW